MRGPSSAKLEMRIEHLKEQKKRYERANPNCEEVQLIDDKIKLLRMDFRLQKMKHERYLDKNKHIR